MYVLANAFASFFESKNLRPISPHVQSHLRRVYLTLCCALISSALGAYLHILWNIDEDVLKILACIGAFFGTMIWLLLTPPNEEQKRVSLLMASALLAGASIAPLIQQAILIDTGVLATAFVATALALACFSGAAMLARRRDHLHLGGMLSSSVSMLFWLCLASYIFAGFGGSTPLFKIELYLGLLIFVCYVAVDTQEIIERAEWGDLDYVKHSVTLFTDFGAVTIHLLSIMIENYEKSKRKKKKRRDYILNQ